MAWVQAAIMVGSAAYSAMSSNAQNSKQKGWNEYNAQMQYGTSMNNAKSQATLSNINAQMQANATRNQMGIIKATTELNASIIASTTDYNDALYEEQLTQLWDSVGLDLEQLAMQRAVERGGIVAQQSVSGTVIGEGSNADLIVHQKTMEAMDNLVVNHKADLQAANISNARAQSKWKGEMEIKKVEYEGRLNIAAAASNAQTQIAGAQASGIINANATAASAANRFVADMQGANMTSDMNNQKTGATFASGMFGAASQGVKSYYATKGTTSLAASGSSGVSSSAGTSLFNTSGMNWGGR